MACFPTKAPPVNTLRGWVESPSKVVSGCVRLCSQEKFAGKLKTHTYTQENNPQSKYSARNA